MNPHLQRATLLLHQGRYRLAEEETLLALSADPHDPEAHVLLAFCLKNQEKYEQATEESRLAIKLAPDQPNGYYVLSIILLERRYFSQALEAVGESLRLNPEDPDYYAQQAMIYGQQERWDEAREAAENGLRCEASHLECTNIRAMALTHLGREKEAGIALAGILARDPENALSHTNQGWLDLRQGNPQTALLHFQEALRQDPTSEWAQAGIVEALKARYFVYRLLLKYIFAMGNLSSSMRWVIVLGLYLLYRLLHSISRNNPTLATWLTPLLIGYVLFVAFTWLAYPLSNLLLRFNRFGRLALSRDQLLASNALGINLSLALLSLGGWFWTGHVAFFLLALVFALLSFPIAGTFCCEKGWPRWLMGSGTILLVILGLGVATMPLLSKGKFSQSGYTLFCLGIFLSLIASNLLVNVQSKK